MTWNTILKKRTSSIFSKNKDEGVQQMKEHQTPSTSPDKTSAEPQELHKRSSSCPGDDEHEKINIKPKSPKSSRSPKSTRGQDRSSQPPKPPKPTKPRSLSISAEDPSSTTTSTTTTPSSSSTTETTVPPTTTTTTRTTPRVRKAPPTKPATKPIRKSVSSKTSSTSTSPTSTLSSASSSHDGKQRLDHPRYRTPSSFFAPPAPPKPANLSQKNDAEGRKRSLTAGDTHVALARISSAAREENAAKEKQEELAKMEDEILRLGKANQVELLRSENMQLKSKMSDLESQLIRANQKASETNSKGSKETERIMILERDLKMKQKTMDEQIKTIQDQMKQIEMQKNEISELKKSIENFQRTIQEKDQELERKSSTEKEAARHKRNSSQIDSFLIEKQRLEQQIEFLKKEMDNQSAQIRSKNSENSDLRSQIETLKSQQHSQISVQPNSPLVARSPVSESSPNNRKKFLKAIYDYEAEDEEELELQAGQVIEVLEENSDGWWRGREMSTGSMGIFPYNFTEELFPNKEAVKSVTDSVMGSRPRRGSILRLYPGKVIAKALFTYHGKDEDEISFKRGDLIEITDKDESGWWTGTVVPAPGTRLPDGEEPSKGFFPANYVIIECE